MDNNNSPGQPPHDEAEENNNNHNTNIRARAIEVLETFYRPPISFNCITDNPRTRSSLIVLQMPRVPFVVVKRLVPGLPPTAVTCGVVPLGLCENYSTFMFLLRTASRFCCRDTLNLEGPSSRNDPVPGYDLWYEMMGPVRTRVPFYTHSWLTFKARVRLVVLEKRC